MVNDQKNTQTLMKLLSTMKATLNSVYLITHTIQSELTTGLNEHQEIMNLRAENVRLHRLRMSGKPIVSLKMSVI